MNILTTQKKKKSLCSKKQQERPLNLKASPMQNSELIYILLEQKRKESGTGDMIFIPRQILEKCRE